MIRSSAHLSSSGACYRDACLVLEAPVPVIVESNPEFMAAAVREVYEGIGAGSWSGHVIPRVAADWNLSPLALKRAFDADFSAGPCDAD
jgi:hypothetical protein